MNKGNPGTRTPTLSSIELLHKTLDSKIEIQAQILRRVETSATERHEDVKREFAEVKKRQDATNGNVTRNTLWVNRMIGGLVVISALIVPVVVSYMKGFVS